MADDSVFNVFRILGDVSHTLSKAILIWAIHVNQSAEGVSLITQMLYALVFVTRYLNIFWASITESTLAKWNFGKSAQDDAPADEVLPRMMTFAVFKSFYIISSFYIILIMMRIYARTREREKAWKLGAYCLGGSVILAPFATVISEGKETKLYQILWTFSIILESVCVMPQLLLLRQTTVPTVIDSFYLLTLGSYRAFYILNWIVRLASPPRHHFEWRAVLFGIIQTAFYVDFAWVYWTRQRVKLRNGGIVDSDDLSRGFLVSRVLGRGDTDVGDEERAGLDEFDDHSVAPGPPKGGKWGTRGISVSADEAAIHTIRERPGTDARDTIHSKHGFSDLAEDDNRIDASRPEHQVNTTPQEPLGGEHWQDESGQ